MTDEVGVAINQNLSTWKDTKDVIRSRKSKKNTQYNDEK